MLEPRPTRSDDVPGILALIGQVFAEYGCVLDLDDDPHLRDPGEYFRRRGGEFWVVDDGGAIRATIAVQLHANAGELKCLYVHPSLRRQGWGRRLSEMVIDFIRRAGRTQVMLWSDTRFEDAHRLYRAMGFTQHGQRDLHDSNNTTEFEFRRAV